MTSGANIDDYYAQVPPSPVGEGADTKVGGPKLKIKAKKVSDHAPIETPPVVASPGVEIGEKKPQVFVPTITFEKAPAIAPKPPVRIIPQSVEKRPESPKKPTAPVQRPPKGALAPNVPQQATGLRFDTSRNFKVRKPQIPRISFEPAPKIVIAPKPPVQQNTGGKPPVPGTPGSPNRLQAYAKTHQNAPKRGRNSLPNKKPGTPTPYEKPKKGFKTPGTGEDDGKFRRGKKIDQDRRERDSNFNQILVDRTGQEIAIPEMLSVKEFSEKIGVPLVKIIGELMKNGMMTNINTKIDFDTCYLIGSSFQVKVSREASTDTSVSDIMDGNISELLKNDDPEKLIPRAPIISIMGHVDHGKTSILDYIRKTQVASGEAGGITQKIGAYQVEKNGKKITFLDTPGHEAFSIMRSRGAKLTDLAVIVIAADEGMKPQTIESINHAKAAEIPMIIAVNKMDKPGANLDLIRGQLAEQGLQPEEWGGNTVIVPVSAHTGLGIETLIDMILLLTDMMELKAHPSRASVGTVIESHLDPKLGPLATVLINAGLLKKGDYITCAHASGRVRALKDYKGKNMDEAGPATPVQVVGLSHVVEGGDLIQTMPDSETAARKAHEFQIAKSTKSIHNFEGASLNMLLTRIKTGSLKQLKIVLKCDTTGSLEALKSALGKLSTDETKVTFIHSGVGEVNDSDALMAGTSQALLVAYNVSVNIHARHTLANSKIEFIDKKVIYHILEKVEAIITGMVDLRFDNVELGHTKVKAIFFSSKDKLIVGMEVKEGKIENKAKIRVIRNGEKIGNGEVLNLKTGPLDVHEILAPSECGISFKGDVKIEVGDVLELYKMVARK
jgi:translation initiation factor IF-2